MQTSRVLLSVGLAAIAFFVGLQMGKGQSADLPVPVHGEEVRERLETILQMPEPLVRARALGGFFSQLNPSYIETVTEVYEKNRRDTDEVAEVIFAAWWGRFDPASALDGRIPPNWGGDDPWSRTVMREWVRGDPHSALEAALLIPQVPEPVKLESLRSVIRGWFEHADTDPNDLLPIFDQINQVRPRGEMVNNWARSMILARGIEYSIEYAVSMPDEPMRLKKEMMGRLAAQIAMVDAPAAVAFTEEYADTEAGIKMRTYMVNRWAYVDGPSAMDWALALTSRDRDKVVSRAWRSFSIGGREAALEWMADRSYTRALEPAYTDYLIDPIAKGDYKAALDLVDQLADSERRLRVLRAVGRRWIVDDPEGAEAWMDSIDASADFRKKVRALDRRSGGEQGRIKFEE